MKRPLDDRRIGTDTSNAYMALEVVARTLGVILTRKGKV